MAEEFQDLNKTEQLKAENQFLKMKLMLENGASSFSSTDAVLDPEIENQFLNNIIAFEEHFKQRKTIKVFDKLGRPTDLRPANDIPDDEISETWMNLRSLLNKFNIDVDVCSPNVTHRELYRFTIEELFDHEMDDLDLPGWTISFIYDEFHPDHPYENAELVHQEFLHNLFSKEEWLGAMHYAHEGFVFNDHKFSDEKSFLDKVSVFKSLFEEITLADYEVSDSQVIEKTGIVKGNYVAITKAGPEQTEFKGSFSVELQLIEPGCWYITSIHIEGFNI